ncbi:hypothetical protein ABZ569_32790 [Streptomyces albus]|uniref:hypothetical protein n=1 Tax=Streptomyces albus TaxID=1888 RepID=UPI0033DDB487
MTYLVELRFRSGAVTGQWKDAETADRTFRGWVGLYGDDTRQAVVTLTETGPGAPRLLKRWPPGDASVAGREGELL